jgi:hypothetical protein
MRGITVGAALAAGLVLATPAFAQRGGGGGNNDAGAGLASGLQAGNDRAAGVRSGAGRVYGGYPDGYYGTYYGTRDPGYYRPVRGWGPPRPYPGPPAYYPYR